MESSLKITRGITDVLKPYQEKFEQFKREQQQLPITMFFKKTRAAGEPTQLLELNHSQPLCRRLALRHASLSLLLLDRHKALTTP
jgi:hypothetical protein